MAPLTACRSTGRKLMHSPPREVMLLEMLFRYLESQFKKKINKKILY